MGEMTRLIDKELANNLQPTCNKMGGLKEVDIIIAFAVGSIFGSIIGAVLMVLVIMAKFRDT